MRKLSDDLKFAPVTYATCKGCDDVVSSPDSIWERVGTDPDDWTIVGHVGTTKAHYACRDIVAETFKIRRMAEHAGR